MRRLRLRLHLHRRAHPRIALAPKAAATWRRSALCAPPASLIIDSGRNSSRVEAGQ